MKLKVVTSWHVVSYKVTYTSHVVTVPIIREMKSRSISTRQHGAAPQKTGIFLLVAVRTEISLRNEIRYKSRHELCIFVGTVQIKNRQTLIAPPISQNTKNCCT